MLLTSDFKSNGRLGVHQMRASAFSSVLTVIQRASFCVAAHGGAYQDRKREQCFINYNYLNVAISKYFKYTKMATSGNMTKKSICDTPFSPPLWLKISTKNDICKEG